MRLLPLHLCLLAILLQALFASLPNAKHATLKSKAIDIPKPKKAAGRLVWKRKAPGAKKKPPVKPQKSESKPLIELLLKELVEIVIGYLNDTYSILVSTHRWLFRSVSGIAVDSARLYVITKTEGVKGLDHSLANRKENKRRCMEFGDPQWSMYTVLTSSHDGQCVSFSCNYKASTDREGQIKRSTQWFTHGNEPEGGRFKHATLNDKDPSWGRLSRDGQSLFSYNTVTKVTRVYRIKEVAGKGPAVSMKLKLNGIPRAVSGDGNRVIVVNAEKLEVYDIGKDAATLVCRIDTNVYFGVCALNEDGNEAAFVGCPGGALRIMEVGKVVGSAVNQPAIISIESPESLGLIYDLVYSDGNRLHLLHYRGGVAFFDSSAKTLVPLEVPQEGHKLLDWMISPNADYVATLQCVEGEEKGNGRRMYRTIVKRKLRTAEWSNIFGYETGKGKAAKR